MIHTIITHGGTCHADETFACAALGFLYPDAPILRRDPTPEELADPEIAVIDIGDIYDPETACHDHHQPAGGTGDKTCRPSHSNNDPVASFGMIWNQYALEIIQSVRTGPLDMVKAVAGKIRAGLVRSVDSEDNGAFTNNFTVSKMLIRYNGLGLPADEGFHMAKNAAKEILEREINWHWRTGESIPVHDREVGGDAMSPTEQKVAIAKACGWKPDGVIRGIRHYPAFRHRDGRRVTQDNLPNYPADMNAMQAAIWYNLHKHMSLYDYVENLAKVMRAPSVSLALVVARSDQQAEAFLKTIGKWVES
jgi:hypothetical protein